MQVKHEISKLAKLEELHRVLSHMIFHVLSIEFLDHNLLLTELSKRSVSRGSVPMVFLPRYLSHQE